MICEKLFFWKSFLEFYANSLSSFYLPNFTDFLLNFTENKNI